MSDIQNFTFAFLHFYIDNAFDQTFPSSFTKIQLLIKLFETPCTIIIKYFNANVLFRATSLRCAGINCTSVCISQTLLFDLLYFNTIFAIFITYFLYKQKARKIEKEFLNVILSYRFHQQRNTIGIFCFFFFFFFFLCSSLLSATRL